MIGDMKTLILMNALGIGENAPLLLGNEPSLVWSERTLKKAFPEADLLWVQNIRRPLPDSFRSGRWVETLDAPDTFTFFQSLEKWGKEFQLLIHTWADYPFLRSDLTQELFELHQRYRAEYSFADGFPGGLAPELVNPQILPVLRSWAEKKPLVLDRDFLFQTLSTDMNAFDVETLLSPVDLRMARLSFSTDTKRNRLLCDRFWEYRDLPVEEFLTVVKTEGRLSRTLPASLMVQTTGRNLQVPHYSPLIQFFPHTLESGEHMNLGTWEKLLDQALELSGDLRVFPSLWCEPSQHPQVEKLLQMALDRPGVQLVVETSGLGWPRSLLENLAKGPGRDRVDWIVELDSQNPETYRRLRGEGFEEAQATALVLHELFPGRFWPQTVRLVENEDEMESFFRHWKDLAGQVILQKYNHFSGRLPPRKVADLSPWNRSPCWHAARDLCVLLNGTVVPCRDDALGEMALGNALTENLADLWDRGEALWNRHWNQDYPGLCQNCDEYYTFNF